ncbi:MAG: hypothetical protein QF510_10425, partial [Rhodospirillales bacterium]|nr:hypothetical protein [Rhodospirillales bacterium]
MTGKKLRRLLAVLSILVFAVVAGFTGSPTLSVQPVAAQSGGQVPGGWSGSTSDAEFWRAIRKGVRGTVSIPDKKAAQLVQKMLESIHFMHSKNICHRDLKLENFIFEDKTPD